jgi:hypothetical protein
MPLSSQPGVQLLAEGAVDHGVGFLRVGEHEGEVVDLEVLHLAGQDAAVQRGDLDRAALQGRHRGRVAAQRAAGEHVDLDLAARLGRHEFGELLAPCSSGWPLGFCRPNLKVRSDTCACAVPNNGQRRGSQQGLDHQNASWMSPQGRGRVSRERGEA